MHRIHRLFLPLGLLWSCVLAPCESAARPQDGHSWTDRISALDQVLLEPDLFSPQDGSFSSPALRAIREYDETRDADALLRIYSELEKAQPDEERRNEIESLLISTIKDKRAPFVRVQIACDALAAIGDPASVPALKRLLRKRDVSRSHAARLALERIPGPEAAKALRSSLGRTRGAARIGILHSLGVRRDLASIEILARFARRGRDPKEVAAAISSLGQMGTAEALSLLEKLPDCAKPPTVDALLTCAWGLAREGDVERAAEAFRRISREGEEVGPARAAGLRGLLSTAPEEAMAALWRMIESSSESSIGLRILASIPPTESLALSVAENLPQMSEPVQIRLLQVLGSTGQAAGLPMAMEMAKPHRQEDVRLAALRALGRLPGDASSVAALADMALLDSSPCSQAATEALKTTPGALAEEALLESLSYGATAQRVACMRAISERHMAQAIPILFQMARDQDEAIQMEAIKALKSVAGASEYVQLIDLAAQCANPAVRKEAVSAALRAGAEMEDPDRRVQPYIEAIERTSDSVKASLLSGLPSLSGEQALSMAIQCVTSSNEEIRDAAYRALAGWRDPLAIEPILASAERTSDPVYRVLLMRGFASLLGSAHDRSDRDRLAFCERALDIGLEQGAKDLVFNAIAEIGSEEALLLAEKLGRVRGQEQDALRLKRKVTAKLAGQITWTASHGQDHVDKALDGDPRTRWTSNEAMAPGMWFGGHCAIPVVFKSLRLDTSGSPKDFAPSLDVMVSDGLEDQTHLVESIQCDGPVTTIDLSQKRPRGRFIKLVLTSATPNMFWSIHELEWEVTYETDEYSEATIPEQSLEELASGDGLIRSWSMSGPYTTENPNSRILLSQPFAPEICPMLVEWSPIDAATIPSGVVDFGVLLGGENRVAYLMAAIVASKEIDAALKLGSDDSLKVWLNGDLVYSIEAARPVRVDEDSATIHLRPGRNDLLMKVTQSGGGWGACARLVPVR